MRQPSTDAQGYVLVIVVGLLAALLVMGLSLSAASRTDIAHAQRFHAETSAEFVARAGVAWTVHYLQTLSQRQAIWQTTWQHDREAFYHRRLTSGFFDVISHDLHGIPRYGLQDEEARLNLMTAPPELLGALPGLDVATATTIVAQRQQQPFVTPEDLVQRGVVSTALFYGHGTQAGLAPYVTVWGTGKININTAPAPVLTVIPGMPAEVIDTIIRHRLGADQQPGTGDDQPFRAVAALLQFPAITPEVFNRLEPWLTVTPTAFRGTVTGHVGPPRQTESPASHRRLVIVEHMAEGTTVRYWRRTE